MMQTKISKVTRKGQVTIPSEFRVRHGIVEGTIVQLTDEGSRLILEPIPDLSVLAGIDAGRYDPNELKKMLDESREKWR